jgi:hypothetical protein
MKMMKWKNLEEMNIKGERLFHSLANPVRGGAV